MYIHLFLDFMTIPKPVKLIVLNTIPSGSPAEGKMSYMGCIRVSSVFIQLILMMPRRLYTPAYYFLCLLLLFSGQLTLDIHGGWVADLPCSNLGMLKAFLYMT